MEWTTLMVLHAEDKTEFFRLLDDVNYSHVTGGGPLKLLDDLGWWLQDKDRLYYTLLHHPAQEKCLVLNLACGYGLVLDLFYQFGYRRFIAVDITPETTAAVRQFFVDANYPGIHVDVVNSNGIEFIEQGPPILEDFLIEATAFTYTSPDGQDYVTNHMDAIKEKYGKHLRHVCVNGYFDSDVEILRARKKRSVLVRLDRKIKRIRKRWATHP